MTDEQLLALLKIGLMASSPLSNKTSLLDWWVICVKLKKMGLVEYTTTGFSITELGNQELQRNIVHAFSLAGELLVPLGDIYSYMEPLSIGELAELLAHPNAAIRRFATLRVEELRGETERVRSQLE